MAQGKHASRSGRRRGFLIAEIICIIVVIVCAVLIFMQVSKYWAASEEFNTITEEYDRNPNALVTDNPNCVGWIKVADTRIDYPVMYTPDDPEYYLHRNFEGEYSSAGTPFLGKGCLLDGNSSIIYGHNMNDGSMFASLRSFDNPDFGLSHVIDYNTIEGATGFGTYQLLGCWYEDLTAPSPYRYWDQVGELSEQQFNDYVANVKQLAMYETGISANYGDDLLALSTCSYGTADERFVVVAVKQ